MREMKTTDIDWIPEMPVTWDEAPNKVLMKKKKVIIPIYDGEDILSLTMDGVIIRDLEAGGKMPTSFDGYQKIESGNLLMCLFDYDVTPRCIGIIKQNGVTSPAYSQYVLSDIADANYYYYYYLMVDNTKELLHLTKNMRHSFSEEDFGRIKAPIPPIDEQKRIAAYLDSKCSEIDALTVDIQSQINTLEQYKRSVITEAVTKGLNKDVEMKESGIPFIGAIPAHWKSDKLKYHLQRNEPRNPGEQEVLSLYRDYGIVPKDSRNDNFNVTSEDTTNYKYVRVGDFVINKMKAWQGSVAVSDYEGIVSPAYYVYKFTDDNIYRRYFHYLLRACYKDEFMRLSGGIRVGQWDLSATALENTCILLPPYEEQVIIADYLDDKKKDIDDAIAFKHDQLATLDAYKKSIIYEYVTGKKEVPSV